MGNSWLACRTTAKIIEKRLWFFHGISHGMNQKQSDSRSMLMLNKQNNSNITQYPFRKFTWFSCKTLSLFPDKESEIESAMFFRCCKDKNVENIFKDAAAFFLSENLGKFSENFFIKNWEKISRKHLFHNKNTTWDFHGANHKIMRYGFSM